MVFIEWTVLVILILIPPTRQTHTHIPPFQSGQKFVSLLKRVSWQAVMRLLVVIMLLIGQVGVRYMLRAQRIDCLALDVATLLYFEVPMRISMYSSSSPVYQDIYGTPVTAKDHPSPTTISRKLMPRIRQTEVH
jgi:hypothetical protein